MRILKINIGGQTETPIDRIDTVAYLIKETFGYEKRYLLYRLKLEPNKGYTPADAGNSTQAARFPTGEHDATRHIVKPLKSPVERRGNLYGSSVNQEETNLYRTSVVDITV